MKNAKQVFIASDHAGFELKAALQKLHPDASSAEWKWEDLGPSTPDRVDYPDYAALLASKISELSEKGEKALGVLICGSGIGMSIAANKFPHIRAAAVESVEAAKLSKEHNNANVLCIGARLLKKEKAVEMVQSWLETPFTEEPRHQNRIQKISELEKTQCANQKAKT